MRKRSVAAVLVGLAVLGGCSGSDKAKDDSGEGATSSSSSTTQSTSGEEKSPTSDEITAAFSTGLDKVTVSTPTEVDLADGKSAWIVDTGPADGTPVLFIGGSATSATAVDLVSFLSSAQKKLGIRLISVERNGFGDTPLDPALGYDDFAKTAIAVLDELGVKGFSIVAISGGGPYAQHVATAVPGRVRSLHLAAAYTGTPDAGSLKTVCGLDSATRLGMAKGYSEDPASWWAFPDDSVIHQIPGFVDAANADGKRALKDPAAMAHEFDLFCAPADVDLSKVDAPSFLYYSPDDTTTPLSFADWFAERLPNVVKDRRELVGNHDEQYRQWDQILADLATPQKPFDLVCTDPPLPEGSARGLCVFT